jgi:hypothetical protein
LGGVKPYIASPPPNQAGNSIYKEISTVLSWPIKLRENLSIEPSIGAFNVFNFANFNRLTGGLNNSGFAGQAPPGSSGSVNGTTTTHTATTGDLNSVRIGTGSGVFAVGGSRQVEFGLRLNF